MSIRAADLCKLIQFYQAFWQQNSIDALSDLLCERVTLTYTMDPEGIVKKCSDKKETLTFYRTNVFKQVGCDMAATAVQSFTCRIVSANTVEFTYVLRQVHDKITKKMFICDTLRLAKETRLIESIDSSRVLLSAPAVGDLVFVVEQLVRIKGVGQVCRGKVLNHDLANGQAVVVESIADGSRSEAVINVDVGCQNEPHYRQKVGTQAAISFVSKTVEVQVGDCFFIANTPS